MPYVYAPAYPVSSLACPSLRASIPCVSLRQMPSVNPSSHPDIPTVQSGMISLHGQHSTGLAPPCSRQGSPVSRGLGQVSERRPTTLVGFGRGSSNAFASLAQDGSSWKMSQGCLWEDLDTSLETWPRFGLMRRGECFPVRSTVRPIKGKGSLSWPTPTTSDRRYRSSKGRSAQLPERALNWLEDFGHLTGDHHPGFPPPPQFYPAFHPKTESAIRGMAHGIPSILGNSHRSRANRALGNSVSPIVAATAFSELHASLRLI